MPSPSPNRLMSDLLGQSRHALPVPWDLLAQGQGLFLRDRQLF